MSGAKPYFFRCHQCLAKNRIPFDKAGQVAKCGKCKAALETQSLFTPQPVMITDANFDRMVMKSPLPVIMDCWAAWCSACSQLSPVIESLAVEWKGRIRVAKLNVEANPHLTARYDLRSLPTLLVFDGGRLKDTMLGALPQPYIVQKMAAFL